EMTSVARKEMVEAVLGEPIEGATFDFDYPAPAYASAYEEKLGTTVRFERPGTAMRLPAAWLRRRSAMADASMFRISLERLEERTRQLARREFVVAHVEELLASAGDAGMSIEEAARALGMSRRSLTRRLAEHGTSFREVRDDHLRSRAERLLRDPDLHLADVAFRLGYRDVANFGRASRRWFGMPPGRFRRSLAEG
ncbi:MAG: helix-turn-helix domain-containing protein, partial [Myxococcota bacterium]|nr:helix-turn-helix domain-containing protein [Myxococcota bacterium]